jgi:hypothetical protein
MKPSDLKKQAQELIARGEMIKLYRVTWEIDLDAASPRASAEKALEIQRDSESIATVFSVREIKSEIPLDDEVIDLSKSRKRRKR